MRAIILPAFALALGAGFFAAPQEAQARFSPEQVQAPSLVDNVQCITRRVRTVRPNGAWSIAPSAIAACGRAGTVRIAAAGCASASCDPTDASCFATSAAAAEPSQLKAFRARHRRALFVYSSSPTALSTAATTAPERTRSSAWRISVAYQRSPSRAGGMTARIASIAAREPLPSG